jgi:predicted PurR-regulated permease PerM
MPKLVRLSIAPLVLATAAGLALWVLLVLLYQVLWVLVLVLLALILSAAILPIVRRLRTVPLPGNRRIPPALAVLLVYVVAGLVILTVTYLVGTSVTSELASLLSSLPAIAVAVSERLSTISEDLGIPIMAPSPQASAIQAADLAAALAAILQVGGLLSQGVAAFTFQLLVLLTLVIFLIADLDHLSVFWVSLFPPDNREKARVLTSRIGKTVGFWALGLVVEASIIAFLAWLGSTLIGLPYPVLLGMAAFLVDMAPMVGPALLSIPVLLLGLSQSWLVGIAGALLFMGLSGFDANVLAPLISSRAVRISPILTIVAVPIGLTLYGVIGALIAIPVTAMLQIIVVELLLPWLHRQYGEVQA